MRHASRRRIRDCGIKAIRSVLVTVMSIRVELLSLRQALLHRPALLSSRGSLLKELKGACMCSCLLRHIINELTLLETFDKHRSPKPTALHTPPKARGSKSLNPSASPSPPSRFDRIGGSSARLLYTEKLVQATKTWDLMEEDSEQVKGKSEVCSPAGRLFSTTPSTRQNTATAVLDARKVMGTSYAGRSLSKAEVASLCEGIDFEEDVEFSFEDEQSGGGVGEDEIVAGTTNARIIKRSSLISATNCPQTSPMLSHDLFSPSSSSLLSHLPLSARYDPLVSPPRFSPHSTSKIATTSSPHLFTAPFPRPSSMIPNFPTYRPFSSASSLSAPDQPKMMSGSPPKQDALERDEILLEMSISESEQPTARFHLRTGSKKRGEELMAKIPKKVVPTKLKIIEISDGNDVIKSGTAIDEATGSSVAALPKARGKGKEKAVIPAIEIDLSDDDEVRVISAAPLHLTIDSSPSTSVPTSASKTDFASAKPTLPPLRPGFFRRPFPQLDKNAPTSTPTPTPTPSTSILPPLPVTIIRAKVAKPTYVSRLTKPDKPLTALQATKKAKLDKKSDKQQKLRTDYPIDFVYTKWKPSSGGEAEMIYTIDEKVVERVLQKMTG